MVPSAINKNTCAEYTLYNHHYYPHHGIHAILRNTVNRKREWAGMRVCVSEEGEKFFHIDMNLMNPGKKKKKKKNPPENHVVSYFSKFLSFFFFC